MDSLLASYASSDDDDDERQPQQQHHAASFSSKQTEQSSSSSYSKFSSFSSVDEGNSAPVSVSKASSLFFSLPQPKQIPQVPKHPVDGGRRKDDLKPSSEPNSSSLFSRLPLPKSRKPEESIFDSSSLGPTPKRVVQFRPPISLTPVKSIEDEDEEDDGEKERKRRKQSESQAQHSSVKSFLSSIPAPRNSGTLGVLQSSGPARRSIVETEAPPASTGGSGDDNEPSTNQNVENFVTYESGNNQSAMNYAQHEEVVEHSSVNYEYYGLGVGQYPASNENYGAYGSYDQNVGISGDASGYGSYENYGAYASYDNQYGNTWEDGSGTTMVPEAKEMAESAVKVPGKRGKNEVPTEIVEVKQDELMKNRPREDQMKLTGIAFGPSYQCC
ncbi:uncharacterized protein LOC110806817 isoform X2 [Carica papaya]|uniref:uncharacterized protein LOC110806817 isoform X2 n=1 Tax=Carica papaya TaxID=3649 RepID=UPI000B8C9179|nr:uncharacterized protein LOC110806817 isoform X2 [Carica papaya]